MSKNSNKVYHLNAYSFVLRPNKEPIWHLKGSSLRYRTGSG